MNQNIFLFCYYFEQLDCVSFNKHLLFSIRRPCCVCAFLLLLLLFSEALLKRCSTHARPVAVDAPLLEAVLSLLSKNCSASSKTLFLCKMLQNKIFAFQPKNPDLKFFPSYFLFCISTPLNTHDRVAIHAETTQRKTRRSQPHVAPGIASERKQHSVWSFQFCFTPTVQCANI